jgi:hypothetical protein
MDLGESEWFLFCLLASRLPCNQEQNSFLAVSFFALQKIR